MRQTSLQLIFMVYDMNQDETKKEKYDYLIQ
jgi:hypothetical protein